MGKLRGFDYTLIITPIVLSIFGTIMIYSASMVSTIAVGLDGTHYLKRQLIWLSLGLVAFFITAIIPYQFYRKLVKPLVLFSIAMLIIVLISGDVEYNAVRSISVAGIRIQPSEFVKLVIILYIADIYSKKQTYINNFAKGVLPPLILIGIFVGLIIMQPDIGTAFITLLIATVMISSSGILVRHIVLLSGVILGLVALLIPYLTTEKRLNRIYGAYQPFLDPDASGHHLIQSYLAIGGGGVSGEGLGQSIQKLGYLWGAHTDFIMAVISEELGVIGVVIVIGLLSIIVLRGLFIAHKCTDSFGALIAIGISAMVGIQSFINLGAISGLLPITGVTLPFLSYGGSSLLVLMISMGILNNIARKVGRQDDQRTIITENPINEYRNRSGQAHG